MNEIQAPSIIASRPAPGALMAEWRFGIGDPACLDAPIHGNHLHYKKEGAAI